MHQQFSNQATTQTTHAPIRYNAHTENMSSYAEISTRATIRLMQSNRQFLIFLVVKLPTGFTQAQERRLKIKGGAFLFRWTTRIVTNIGN